MYKDDSVSQQIRQVGFPVDIFSREIAKIVVPEFFGESNISPINLDINELNTKDVQLVTGGCSFTYGAGVPSKMIWSNLLSNKLNLNYVSFAERGWSTEQAVTSVLTYLRKHPHPKYVAMLIPDLRRIYVPINKFLHHGGVSVLDKNELYLEFLSVQVRSPWYESPAKYSKKPHDLRHVLSPEMAVYQSCKAIKSLIEYCQLNNIKLIWSTWDKDAQVFFEDCLKVWDIDLGNYVKIAAHKKEYADIGLPDGCHLGEAELYGENYYTAFDEGRHSGIHQHIHWAEDFYNKILEIDNT